MNILQWVLEHPSVTFDIICAVLLFVFALGYARKGFLSTVFGLVGNLASVVVAYLFSRDAAPWLFNNLMAEGLKKSVSGTILESGNVDLAALVEQYGSFLPESLRQMVLQGVGDALNSSMSENAAQLAETLVTTVLQPLLVPVLSIVLFFVAFALCRMVVGLITGLLGMVNKIPVLGGVNRTLGFVAGIVAGGVDLFLVLCGVWTVMVITGGSLPVLNEADLAASAFYRLFLLCNPFTAA